MNSNSILSAPEDIFNILNLSSMKRFTFILCFLLSNFAIFSQIRTVCSGVSTNFQTGLFQGEYRWTIEDRNTGASLDGSVATISTNGGISFNSATTGANSVNITFNNNATGKGNFRIRWERTTSNWFYTTVRGGDFFDVDVPVISPTFAFTSPSGLCGATFTMTNPQQVEPSLQWSRLTNGSFVDIPGATGPTVTVNPPFVRLRLTATSVQCNEVLSFDKAPPAGLGDFKLSDGNSGMTDNMGAIEACTPSSRLQSATARFCDGTNNWTWTTDGSILLVGNPTNGTAVSTVSFRLLSGAIQRSASITATNGGQQRTLFYTILAYPACRNQQQLARPNDTNPILPTSAKSESDKIAITDEPNADLKTENTEGVTVSSANNKTIIKKGLYPNPANDVLNVDNIQGVQSLQIMDLNGKIIRTISIEENEVGRTLNVSNLSNGMYILKKIRPDGQLEAAKFQVIH
jgi:Secretion system C-terminal sorting domain